jgi:hypothetical protein
MAATDNWNKVAGRRRSVAEADALALGYCDNGEVCTPADTDLTNYYKYVLCSADCTLKVTTVGGSIIVSVPFFRGYNPIAVKRIWSTGSTVGSATIIGLW